MYHQKCRIFLNFRFSGSSFDGHFKGVLTFKMTINTERESENIMNVLLVSHVLMKSKAKSADFDSAVKTVQRLFCNKAYQNLILWRFSI